MRTSSLAVRVQLPLGWNTYLLFDSDIVNFVWKTDEGEVLQSLVDKGWWGRKSYSGPAETSSFSNRYFSPSNKHDTFWHVVLTGYFYDLFLWATAPSDFLSLEIYKASPCLLSRLQSTATQITISINIFMFQIFYSMKSVCFFLNKIHVKVLTKVFHIQTWFKCEVPLLFFLIRTMVYHRTKSVFAVDCVKITDLHIVHTCNLSRWNRRSNDIYKKDY